MLRLRAGAGKPEGGAKSPRQRPRAGLAALRFTAGRAGRLTALRALDLFEPEPAARREVAVAAPAPGEGAAFFPES